MPAYLIMSLCGEFYPIFAANNNAMKMTQCQIGKIGLIEDNIVYVEIDSGSEIGIEHIFEFKNVASELVEKTKKVYTIISYGEYSLTTKEAREFCGREEKNNSKVLGRAVVVHGLGQMIIAKHTIKQRKSSVPTRIFTDASKAKVWVNNLRSKAGVLQCN